MLQSASSPVLPSWRQPLGVWRARGAHPFALRAGLGLATGTIPTPAPLDDKGFSLWHYWANSPRPHESFPGLAAAMGRQHCDHLAQGGFHPWHYLLSQANPLALEAWAGELGVPAEAPPTEQRDTFAHCAAWSGNPLAIGMLDGHDLVHLNGLDASGLTPLIVAIHRGGRALAQAFLMAGSDPMACDWQGRNALHHAAQYGDSELVAVLEDAGGDADATDEQGLCARSIVLARRGISPQARQALAEHWARRWSERLPF